MISYLIKNHYKTIVDSFIKIDFRSNNNIPSGFLRHISVKMFLETLFAM